MNNHLKKTIAISKRRDEWFAMSRIIPTKWFVYIVKCVDETYYTGITTNVMRRLEEHNSRNRGSKYTRSRRPVHLVCAVEVENMSDALKLEHKIKKMKRNKKVSYLLALKNK